MNEDKIMSVEAFNEIIDCFEIVGSLTEYGRKNIKYHVKKLQQENQELKEKLEISEKARKEAIEFINNINDWEICSKYDCIYQDDVLEILKKLDVDKGE